MGAILWFVSALSAVAEEPAPLPKEGSSSTITIGSLTAKVLPLGKDRVQFSFEFLGASVSDDGKGLTHNASVRCIGSVHAVNGAYETFTNSCILTRPDGDQLFLTDKGTGRLGGQSQGTSTITGGTGKLAGITGTSEWTRYNVRSALEGTAQTVTRSKLSYKLP
ncbi:MAG: hypothetical protein HZB56_15430 [Deltaproteobacteria bacterium]|nr:hypothetical protein [Deltaproteobacteria bacterium]